jgi:hypothetical protein
VSRRALLAVFALAAAACTTERPAPMAIPPTEPRPLPGAYAPPPPPLGSGRVTVRGGEELRLRGATVAVERVTFLDVPCPKDVQCVHSGVIKTVGFRVAREGGPVPATLREGESRVVEGVELRVVAVRQGPEADVEAALPLAPQ